MSEREITNESLFRALRGSGLRLYPFDQKCLKYLVTFLKDKQLPTAQKETIESKVDNFRKVFSRKWQSARHSELNFRNKEKVWLERVVFSTPSSTEKTHQSSCSRGRPSLSFQDSNRRTKRLKAGRLAGNYSDIELLHGYSSALWKKGERLRAKVVKTIGIMSSDEVTAIHDTLNHPERPADLTAEGALAFLTNNNLTKSQYLAIRRELIDRKICVFPSYKNVLAAKKKCLPADDDIKITETSAQIKLQGLVNTASSRLAQVQQEVISQHVPNNKQCVLIWKWGMDGSSNQSRYKQKFTEENSESSEAFESQPPQPSDANMFNISAVPLILQFKPDNSQNNVILWQNSSPGSARFCRPIKFVFKKENDELVLEEKKLIELEIKDLVPSNVVLSENSSIQIKHEFHLTMVDGKTCNCIVGNKSSQNCYLCGCKPSEFNKLEDLKAKLVLASFFSLGLSTLHAWIKFFECITHIGYRLNIKDAEGNNVYQVRTPEQKCVFAEEKDRIKKNFKAEMGLIVDQPKQGGGTSNDGNTARRFFENYKTSFKITGVKEELIRRLYIILCVLASGFSIDVDKFKAYTAETAKMYVESYSWYPMPPTLQKILMHGGDVINSFELPIGYFTEEALERRNKDYRKFREFFSRERSRLSTNEDVFKRLLLTSDPVISSTQMFRAKKKGIYSRNAQPAKA